MDIKTHKKIDERFSGKVIELKNNYSKVLLKTIPEMVADEEGLVHGGFTFSAADYAAMVAVNDPYVVLVAADVKFTAPVKVGEEVIFEANLIERDGKKSKVEVVGKVYEVKVFEGVFKTYSLDKHILS
ncbi:hotdog domain-containing protein [Nitrosophilus kaiyonis]|uniref:hotdog domain-containing protein n=1 Tax=Nitrosophilus kaiyonis TaxID=2930200 RepID=UPI00248FB0DC|nr:hotdog domain-containing protein [Nitrosophilus kaiyonis]